MSLRMYAVTAECRVKETRYYLAHDETGAKKRAEDDFTGGGRWDVEVTVLEVKEERHWKEGRA